MNRSAGAILEQAGDYAAAFSRGAAHLTDGGSSAAAMRLASDAELLDGLACISQLARLVDGERARLAGEVARRSPAGDDTSLAKRMGAPTAKALVAQRAFLPITDASALVRLGEATRPGESFAGEPLPAARPHIAAAIESGVLPIQLAMPMLRCLTVVSTVLSGPELEELEAHLLAALDDGWSVEELLAWLKKVPETIDPDLARPREDDLRALAKVTEHALQSGLTRFVLDLDPETAGLFKTAMDAGASLKRPKPTFLDAEAEDASSVSEADAAAEQTDRRPLRQRRVDGIRVMATRALKADEGQVGGTAVTMLVTIDIEALLSGIGSAVIDGIDAPISAATARMLAVHADLIPVVLGGDSVVLDMGQSRRFFTAMQRRAMAARDGGCIGPGCTAPASACEGAHLVPAGHGPTSLTNGALLCWWCHRLHDLHGWQVERGKDRWWWTPPPSVDPLGRRRPGGRIPPPAPPTNPWKN